MAILTIANPTLPNQNLGAGDYDALNIEQFTGLVEGTLERRSKFAPFVQFRPVRGTSTLTTEGIGESEIQKLERGVAPDPTKNQAARVNLTVDTPVIARAWIGQMEDFQKNYSFRSEIASEHGKKIAKFLDQAIAIQAFKAAMLGTSAFGALPGHQGGTKVTLTNAADILDPAILYNKLGYALAEMEEKDVDPGPDGVMCALPPKAYYALADADQIVNTEYTTANGETIRTNVIKAWDIPVIRTNNLPKNVITGHYLSNAKNGNAFDGDFSKLGALLFSPRALLAGETIPLESKIWWDDFAKGYYVDAWLAFSATPARAEFAATLLKP